MITQMVDDGEGARVARQRRRRHLWTAAILVLAGLAVGTIMALGATGPGHIRPGYAVATVIAMAIVLPLAVRLNDQTTDELDRLIALRANSFGLYACLLGAFSWMVLFNGGLVPQPNMLVLFLATGVVTLGRYAMLKMGRQ